MSKKIAFVFFIGIALVQLYVPASMIWKNEDVLKTGNEFKFKTAPIDPNDPFRGKYISLRYEENEIDIKNDTHWNRGEIIYVIIKNDEKGFAKILSVSTSKPNRTNEYVRAKIAYISDTKLTIEYPFDRYYMEESKANAAEIVYAESQIDSNQIAYALVNIKKGEAVLKDVVIDGKSIKDLVKERNKSNN